MPYVRVWIHLIWSTKNRSPLLTKELKKKVLVHIKENASQKGIFLDTINGVVDHIHALVSLRADQTVAKVAQLLKGESSHWINEQDLALGKFEWQDEYIAVSISESILDRVREYIKNQEEHHRKKTFAEEYQDFMKKYGFEILSANPK
jgi:REP element-mobilizing transposase RayT